MTQSKASNRKATTSALHCKRRLAAFCIPMVAQLTPSDAATSTVSSDEYDRFLPELGESIRRAKAVAYENAESQEQPLTLANLVTLADGCVHAYALCDRPVRSDLLSQVCTALAVTTFHYSSYTGDDRQGQKTLQSIGLVTGCEVDVLENLAVLAYDLRWCAGFAPPDLAVHIAMGLRDALKLIPEEVSSFVIDSLEPMFEGLITVAMSPLFKRGLGYIAPGVGPASARAVSTFLEGDVGITVSYAPDFSAILFLKREGVSIPMDRDTLRSVMALFIGDASYVRPSYPSAALTMPTKERDGVLKLSNAVALAISFDRYLAAQKLFSKMCADPEFVAWRNFRALQFGDL